jgi:hypothetical protein
VVFEAFDARPHLSGVVEMCRPLQRANFRYDPDLTRRSLTAPGVTTIIAVARDPGGVVGFAQVFGDGTYRRTWACSRLTRSGAVGVGRLVEEALARVGAVRMGLVASDESLYFYGSLRYRGQAGFRI